MPKLPKRTTSPKKVSRGSRRSLPRAGLIRRGRGGGFKIIKETGRRSSGSRWLPCCLLKQLSPQFLSITSDYFIWHVRRRGSSSDVPSARTHDHEHCV